MFERRNILVIILIFVSLVTNAQEDTIRFFDLETKPTISVLYDQTYKRNVNNIYIPTNIYASSNQRRSINMAEQIQRKEAKQNFLAQIYQSRIDQQQSRISENYRSTVKKESAIETDAEAQFRQPYNYQPYGWQNSFYNSSSRWRPSFYQDTSFGRLRANRFLFY